MTNRQFTYRLIYSPAFRHGFSDGFTSMFRLAGGGRGHRYAYTKDTVGAAWSEVGDFLNEATRQEGQRIEQTARKTRKRQEAL